MSNVNEANVSVAVSQDTAVRHSIAKPNCGVEERINQVDDEEASASNTPTVIQSPPISSVGVNDANKATSEEIFLQQMVTCLKEVIHQELTPISQKLNDMEEQISYLKQLLHTHCALTKDAEQAGTQ